MVASTDVLLSPALKMESDEQNGGFNRSVGVVGIVVLGSVENHRGAVMDNSVNWLKLCETWEETDDQF